MLAMTMDAIRDRSMDAKGTQAVMGGTEESMAATKAANANALADTAANIAIDGAARKDEIENSYRAKKDSINEKLNKLTEQKANNIINAVNGVSDAASDIASNSGFNDIRLFGKK
jgi:GMP synthase PP-ATPase subunit